MLVKNWMSHPAITIDTEAYIREAANLMETHHIRGLPVMRDGRLVGYITDKDIKRASASEVSRFENAPEIFRMITSVKVREFMTKNPMRIPISCTIDRAAEIMLKCSLSSAPVVDSADDLKGVVSQTDVFRALVSFVGVKKDGIQFAFQLEDRPGSIKEVTDLIRIFGGRIESILSSSYRAPEGFRKVYVRVYGVDESRVHELKTTLIDRFSVLYIIEQRGEKHEVYEKKK